MIFLILINTYLLFSGLSSQEFDLNCPADWKLDDKLGSCFKWFAEPLYWEDAQATCKAYGANLVEILSYEEGQKIFSVARKFNDSIEEFWIGLRKNKNQVVPGEVLEAKALWDGSDRESSLSEGFWYYEQPNLMHGDCTYLGFNSNFLYNKYFSLESCLSKKSFLCQSNPCLTGQFRCNAGNCIKDSYKCDNKNDCGDDSDELNCPGVCKYVIDDINQSITKANYDEDEDCIWLLQTDVGRRIKLDFTKFITEKDRDVVEIWSGGRSISTSNLLSRYSGDRSSSLPVVYSNNNFLIIRFYSDSAKSLAGFEATWSSVDRVTTGQREFKTNGIAEFTSPNYPNSLLGGLREEYTIEAENYNGIVTIEKLELNLGARNYLIVKDGKDPNAPTLATYEGESGPSYVTSTGKYLKLYLKTDLTQKSKGFKFSYKEGCDVTISSTAGVIISPGYDGTTKTYPPSQMCTWNITSPGGSKIILQFDTESQLAEYGNTDTIKIFDGLSGLNEIATITKSDKTIGPKYEANTGSASIQFTTGAVESGIGFKSTFSGGCPSPQFNSNTEPNSQQTALKSKITVTCKEGFAFAQEEHRGKSSVEMTCEVDGWDVHAIPNCEAISCNIPQAIQNGYVLESSGITFGKTIKYACKNGYQLVGNDVITCQKSGLWTSKPTCSATSCGNKFETGNYPGKKLLVGQGGGYGSVWTFSCPVGQELNTYPTIVCKGNQWSTKDEPACKDVTCKMPIIDQAIFSQQTPAKYNEVITVSCKTGYKIKGNDTITCGPNSLFIGEPECIDEDECESPPKHDCVGNAKCKNTKGSFECECPSGYSLKADKKSCENINECQINNGTCDHKCEDLDGSYKCSCNDGFDLFDVNGKNGFFIPPGETGLESWNKFHLNHSCIRVRCPLFKEDSIANGYILALNALPAYQDRVYIRCNLGYILPPNEEDYLTCTANGIYDRAPPNCIVATCVDPNKNSVSGDYFPIPEPQEVNFGAKMNLSCNTLTIKPETYEYKCQYDFNTHTYKVVRGINKACQNVINCGQFTGIEGVEPIPPTAKTIFRGQVDFKCKPLFQLKGENKKVFNNRLSYQLDCIEDYWNFGSLRCEGQTCSDPGTPPGGKQTGTAYAVNSKVEFTCDRPGFEPSTKSITCVSENNQIKWDGPLASCNDEEKPKFQNCPSSTVSIDKLKSAGIPQITASDNSGRVKSLTVDPVWFTPNVALSQSLNVTYTAEDPAGNKAECSFTVRVKDDQPPNIICPDSYIYRIKENVDNYDIAANTPANATDNLGIPTISYNPSSIDLTTNDAVDRKNFVITATATDSDGNTAQCKFMITAIPEKCQPWAVRAPKNGYAQEACKLDAATGIGSCVFRCNPGYTPRQITPAGTNDIEGFEMSYQCDSNQNDAIWKWEYENGKFLEYIPDCQSVQIATFLAEYDISYDSIGTIPSNKGCDTYYKEEMKKRASSETEFLKELARRCNGGTGNVFQFIVRYVDKYFTYAQTKPEEVKYHLAFNIEPIDYDDKYKGFCETLIEINLSDIFEDLTTSTIPATSDCPSLKQRNDSNSVINTRAQNNLVCQKGQKLVKTIQKNSICVECDKGTYYNETVDDCITCPAGEYQDEFGQTSCKKCGDDKWTLSTGSASQTDCKPACKTYGMISANRIGPCVECKADSYMVSSSECKACEGSKKTEGSGSTSENDCKEPCPIGSFSRKTGFTDCEKCPVNFYSTKSASTTCQECDGDQYTASDESKSPNDCLDASNLCGAGACNNRGTCSVQGHKKICDCQPGYDGLSCENQINHCLSQPCYNGGTCEEKLNGFTCKCPNSISGDRCEITTKRCTTATCLAGFCKDNALSTECLCPPTHSGDKCQNSKDICDPNPCKNGGACSTSDGKGIHIECKCDSTRFFGKRCEYSKDPCTGNPCLYGGKCTAVDEINYTCDCPSGFSGDDCENVPPCTQNTCGDTGICKFDFVLLKHTCICKEGYVADTGANAGTWLANITTASVGKCVESDACSSGPCQNGAKCETKNTGVGYECKCPPGYSGGNCQNNIDDCASNPCGRYGTKCEDLIADFKCTCQTGVSGKQCDSFIDKCRESGNVPCNPAGTNTNVFDQGCEKIVNSYICHCKDGFEGRNCEKNIDDCPGDVCRHNGTCKDLTNGWKCECLPGWTGKFCENSIDYCDSSPCTNGGSCYSAQDGYFCLCKAGDHGKNCGTDSRMCTKVPACFDKDATCSDNPDGSATCTCSRNYIGESCHIKRDFCSGLGICLNGGQCSYTQGGFSCNCPEDFSGDICENSDDNCGGVSCPATATCVDGIGDYFCECPLGKVGDDCNRNVYLNFDLAFSSPTLTAMAFQRYPFILNLTAFTLSTAVTFDTGENTGNFLNLFGLNQRYLTSDRKEIIKMSANSIKVTLQGKEKEISLTGGVKVNDGKWHYISITWSSNSGTLDVYIDGNRQESITFGQGATLSDYGLFVLGTDMDKTGHNPIEKSGFAGALSQVTLWERVLNAQELTTVVSGLLTSQQLPAGYISLWDNYISSEGVDIRKPSTVCVNKPNCQSNEEDKVAPVILNCPSVPIEKYGSTRHTIVTWDKLETNENNVTIKAKNPMDIPFIWGSHNNLAVATDLKGNKGTCFFKIYIQKNQQCETLTNPTQGTISCKDYGLFTSCKVNCNQGYSFPYKFPTYLSCGPSTSFNVENPFLSFKLPTCSAIVPMTLKLTINFEYSVPACDDTLKQAGVDHWKALIGNLDNDWKRPDNTGAFCGNQDCTGALTLQASCKTTKRRKRATGTKLAISGEINTSLPSTVSRKNPDDTLPPNDVLKQAIIDNNAAQIPTNNNAVPNFPSLALTVTTVCPPGHVDFGKGCAVCSRGTKEEGGVCNPCPIGEYQDEVAQTTCKTCPTGTTELTGSEAETDCKEKCPIGKMFDKGQNKCVDCPIGFYQDVEGSFYCKPCDAMKTTIKGGAEKSDLCIDVCPDGEELDRAQSTRTCKNCTYGFYRKAGIEEDCKKCPDDKTTPEMKSVTINACNLKFCPIGQQPKSVSECEDCPRDKYQDKAGWPKCKSCGTNEGTLDKGSTKESDCLQKCPAGEEYRNGACEKCSLIHYKPSSGVENCTECPSDKRAAATGSKDKGSCVLNRCKLGQKLTDQIVEPGICKNCPENFYQDELYKTDCKPCPPQRLTLNEGSESEKDCITDCPPGEGYDVKNAKCEKCETGKFRNDTKPICSECPLNYYQDSTGATSCKPCPDNKLTDKTGTKSLDDCKNPCQVPGQNPCGPVATCSFSNGNIKCDCKISHYTNGTATDRPECLQRCSDSEFCIHGDCESTYIGDRLPKCVCHDDWEGPDCNSPIIGKSYTNYIIGGVIGGVVFLILLALAIGYAVYRSNYKNRQNEAKKSPADMDPVVAPPSGLPTHRPSITTLGRTIPGTIGHTMPSMTYFPTLVHSRADEMSIAGYSMASKYMYHEDIDESPLKPVRDENMSTSPQNDLEEKMSTIDFARTEPPAYNNGSAKAVVRNT